MRKTSMLLLRVSMGVLTIMWGLDKLVNVEHSMRVSEGFYLGVGANALFLRGFGVFQAAVGVLIVIGLYRRYTYPVLTAISAVTAAGVWRSIIDPWGWYLEDTNVLFYPSAIILAAALVLWSHLKEDTMLCADASRDRGYRV